MNFLIRDKYIRHLISGVSVLGRRGGGGNVFLHVCINLFFHVHKSMKQIVSKKVKSKFNFSRKVINTKSRWQILPTLKFKTQMNIDYFWQLFWVKILEVLNLRSFWQTRFIPVTRDWQEISLISNNPPSYIIPVQDSLMGKCGLIMAANSLCHISVT